MSVAFIHIYFVDDFILFIDAWEQPECVCDYPIVVDAPADQEEDTVRAWEIAKKERATTCAIQCPPLPNDCKLKRRAGDTDKEYTERCRAVKIGVKKGIVRSSFAAGTADESDIDEDNSQGNW